MRLVFLGTSAAHPTKDRGLSCVCLEREGEILMFDAGEAAQMAFMRSGLGWNKKMKILVTHLHGDHCIGILGLLQTMSLHRRTEKIEIFGPAGIEEFISANIKILNFGLSFPIIINIVNEGIVSDEQEYTIYATKADHTVTCFAYRFDEKSRPGRFNVTKAKELNIPKGVLWSKLQQGDTVTVDNKNIRPDQVLGPSRPGKKIGISGDTMPSADLESFFTECDYLVFDSTFLDKEKHKALDTRHSTAKQAATLAKNACVKNLILTHFSARYKNETDHLKEANAIHESVTAARDLLEIEI